MKAFSKILLVLSITIFTALSLFACGFFNNEGFDTDKNDLESDNENIDIDSDNESVDTEGKYTITFNNTDIAPMTFTEDDLPIELKIYPASSDSVFVGWFKESDFSGVPVREITEAGDIELFAYLSKEAKGLHFYDATTYYRVSDCDEEATNIVIPSYHKGKPVTRIGDYAFKNCKSLESITIPSSITSIGFDAFFKCTSLESVTIPDSVTHIGSGTFSYCSSLKSVTMPNGITTIEDSMFAHSHLESITIPSSVTSIRDEAFLYCYAIKSVHISDMSAWCNISFSSNPLSYAKNLYLNGELVKELVIPNDVTKIKDHAFECCESLESVTIPSSITSIGEGAFAGCSALKSINIPSSVTSIGEWAFSSCSALKSITIPSSVTSIGDYAFEDCKALERIHIPGSVTNVGYKIVYNCPNIKSYYEAQKPSGELDPDVYYSVRWEIKEIGTTDDGFLWAQTTNDEMKITGYKGSKTEIELPSEINSMPVTAIEKEAFEEYSSITSIIIPSSITTIEEYAFYKCTSLESVTIQGGVTSIGKHTFSYCYALKSINIPSSVTSIGKRAFEGCNALEKIHIPSSVTYIYEAFNNCYTLKIYCEATSKLNDWFGWNPENRPVKWGIKAIGTTEDGVFWEQTIRNETIITEYLGSKANIKIPSEINSIPVTAIEERAFRDCTTLERVTIENGVKSIGERAFEGCTMLISIEIPSSVTTIGSSAFSDCTSLTSIIIPNSVTEIESAMFSGCEGLTSIEIPNSVTEIGSSAFGGCKGLTSIIIPSSVTSIWSSAFRYCDSLTIYCEAKSQPVLWTSWNPDNRPVEWGIKANGTTDNGILWVQTANDEVTIIGYKGSDTDIEIPSEINSIPVTAIGAYAFANCSNLKSIVIPSGVTYMGKNAFLDCKSITIYCEAYGQPNGWDTSWNPDNRPVNWGYTY